MIVLFVDMDCFLSIQKVMKNEKAVFGAREVSEGVCVRDFCRLGCVCDSLNREPRGSTHCRRVQCMFSCSCFKHKILLVRSPQTGHEHNARSLMAFRKSAVLGSGSGCQVHSFQNVHSDFH